MSIDELQRQLDERFPRGAHVWTRRFGGAEQIYVTPRVIVVGEHHAEVPPSEMEIHMVVQFDEPPVVAAGAQVVFRSQAEGEVILNDNFTPTEELDRLRAERYGPAYLAMVRGGQ